MKKELHILVGCADARDLNQVQIETIARKQKEFLEQDIQIELQVIRAAGSFVSNDVFADIKNILLQYMRTTVTSIDEVSYFVHIQTHGHLTEDSKKTYVSHVFDMRLQEGSPLNCGMLGASGVGIEIEQLLIESKLHYKTRKGIQQIQKDSDIRTLLKEVYAHEGYLAGDWIKSIDFLRTHPRAQKARLEQLISHDTDLRRLNILITAGIQDYAIHGLIRVDGGDPHVAFWDEAQKEIRENASKQLDILKSQSEKQHPLAGLLCLTDPRTTSRVLAADYYYKLRNLPHSESYLPNTIFNITGSFFDVPETPFGPYVIAGFFYAIKHLKLTDQMIMGHDAAQTQRMVLKIKNDPLMNLFVEHFEVNLIPVNQTDLL